MEPKLMTMDQAISRFVHDGDLIVIEGFTHLIVVCEPFGCHPSYTQGYYDRDNDFYLRWREISKDLFKFNSYLDEWIYGVRNRAEYGERLGEALAGLRAQDRFCKGVNYGY